MGRETLNIHSSDFVVFVGGRSGTLGEFCIAYDEGKLIGVLTHSGGISDEFVPIAKLVKKDTESILIVEDRPEDLVDRLLRDLRQRRHPERDRIQSPCGFYELRRPAVTQETRS